MLARAADAELDALVRSLLETAPPSADDTATPADMTLPSSTPDTATPPASMPDAAAVTPTVAPVAPHPPWSMTPTPPRRKPRGGCTVALATAAPTPLALHFGAVAAATAAFALRRRRPRR